jgi:hypothetical protein
MKGGENMKITELIKELQAIQTEHGDIDCYLQDAPPPNKTITGTSAFFLVPEKYNLSDGTDETVVNIRTWPY